jgi:hypothetical protein
MIPFVVGAALLQTMSAAPVPFAVGESYEYSPHYSINLFGSLGGVSLTVAGVDTVRGVPSWHFTMITNVSAPFYKARSRLESWTSVKDFVSRRFIHFVNENDHQYADDDFQIHGDSGYFRNRADTLTKPTPHDALDDLAFVYYLRTMEFQDGKTYRLPRYFRQDHNPVEVTVLGHDTLDMPDGSRRRCWVVHLLVDDGGMFSKKSNAKLWLSDDGIRIPVQIRSDLPVGNVTLKLKRISRTQ